MKTRQVACHLRTSPLRHSKRLPYGVCKNVNANFATLLFLFPQNLDKQSFAGALKKGVLLSVFRRIMVVLLSVDCSYLSPQQQQMALKSYAVTLLFSPYSTSTLTYNFRLSLIREKTVITQVATHKKVFVFFVAE